MSGLADRHGAWLDRQNEGMGDEGVDGVGIL
jgi:hypothetical protein